MFKLDSEIPSKRISLVPASVCSSNCLAMVDISVALLVWCAKEWLRVMVSKFL